MSQKSKIWWYDGRAILFVRDLIVVSQHQLKLIKANNIDSAKSQWYDWKSSWVEQLQRSAVGAFRDLESVRSHFGDIWDK